MAYAQAHVVAVTTDSSGDVTARTPVVNGAVLTIIFTDTDLAAGADFTITTEDTAQNLWVETDTGASKTVAPRQPTHDTAGVASLYASSGEPVEGFIYAANERIKIVVAQGGSVKSGSFTVIVGG